MGHEGQMSQAPILAVDDDDIALDLLRTALEASGYAVATASNGREAVDRLTRGDIRLVISDWEMPEMDGLELCRAVRRNDSAGYVYIILLTSHGKPREIVEGMSAGADDFIVKPFNQAELTARIRAGSRVLSLETREMVIFALAKLAESRDPETGLHLERVQRFSRRLAESLVEGTGGAYEIDSDFIRLVYQTSPLHDIGKVGIPDSILLKPGRLSDDEYEIMKSHTTLGAETLGAALANFPQARFLQVARDIAQSHHERWNGSGYPRGLSGESIPLAARIVAVADVYDALTSRRVYKEAYPHKVARDIIVEDAGTHFDPQLVEAFLRAEDDILQIRERFSEDSVEATAPVPAVPGCVPMDAVGDARGGMPT
jgi:putative two-component system response regulator